jgi:hypothetical protein
MMYEKLFEEIEAINRAFGWVGALDALMYIQGARADYSGEVAQQFDAFMREGAKLFAPVNE